MEPESPTYLGDGLYVEHDGYQYRLFASNGIHTTNEVFLDPRVLEAFQRYLASRKEPS
jgi:hypothetical protein